MVSLSRAEYARLLTRQVAPAASELVAQALLDWPVRLTADVVVCWLAVPGEPVVKSRPRVVIGRGLKAMAYTPSATKAHEQRIRDWMAVSFPRLTPVADHEIGVRVRFACRTRKRRDLDNLVKLLLDALNGVAWIDDTQVSEVHAEVVRTASAAKTEFLVYKTNNTAFPGLRKKADQAAQSRATGSRRGYRRYRP